MSRYPKWAKKIEKKKVDEEEVMEFIKKAKIFSTREVMNNFQISQRQALNILWKLNALGKIDKIGHGVWRIRD
jgi:predicted transcriptional regulator of viral defense system